ncbi:MAG: hypothetical protein JXB88_19435, partial [Spirochaetales bacterium]|nr:hypothetical protein [Spirochaetales bacterium]
IETLAFSPDGKILASGSRESTFIELWDTKTGNRVKKLIGHNDSIKTLAFSPDGKALASGGYDNDIIVWRTPVKAVSITASSYIDYKNMYTPAAVFDENPGTGWLEAQDGPGIGEKVMLELNEEIKVDEIMVMPGYFDPGWWASNNRVKKLKMITGDKEMVGEFTNEMKAQIMQLPGEVCFKKVIFEIVDIFASGKDNDTGISEIFFYYKGERVEIIL